VGVVPRHVFVDGAFQVGHTRKARATNPLLAEFASGVLGLAWFRQRDEAVVN
jgi:hypothetical protein